MRRTIAIATIASSLCMLAPLSAGAATVVAAEKELSSCMKVAGKDLGRCYADRLKQWQRSTKDFVNTQERKHRAWRDENASMGRSPEYLKMLKDFSEALKKEGDDFFNKQKEEKREFFNARKKLEKAGSQLDKRTSSVTNTKEALKVCTSRVFAIRNACIRSYVRPGLKRFGSGSQVLP